MAARLMVAAAALSLGVRGATCPDDPEVDLCDDDKMEPKDVDDDNARGCDNRAQNSTCTFRQNFEVCGNSRTRFKHDTRSTCSSDGRCRDPSEGLGMCGGKKAGEACAYTRADLSCTRIQGSPAGTGAGASSSPTIELKSVSGTCWLDVAEGLLCQQLQISSETVVDSWDDLRNYEANSLGQHTAIFSANSARRVNLAALIALHTVVFICVILHPRFLT